MQPSHSPHVNQGGVGRATASASHLASRKRWSAPFKGCICSYGGSHRPITCPAPMPRPAQAPAPAPQQRKHHPRWHRGHRTNEFMVVRLRRGSSPRAESEARRDTRYDDVVTRAREPRRRELLITYFFALKNAPEHEIKSCQASGQSGIGSRRISVERLVSRFRNSDI